jgi:general L-amino acid transport system permease protein
MSAEPIVKTVASLAATLIAILAAAWLGWLLLRWAILDATWNANSYADCAPGGACWAVLRARYGLIFFGLFPAQEHSRPAAACAIVIATVMLFQWPRLWRLDVIGAAIVAVAILFLILMYGGLFGASFVSTERWGGFALTLYLYFFGVIVGAPFGVCLALLRRSRHSAVAGIAAFVVDTARSLPMVMVLFTVGVLAPMVLPESLIGDKLWRVALAFAFVYGCYQSEIVRAGLQAVTATQEEAAVALALSPYWRMRLILLPQAITHGLPATINLLVATFKETSIVSIIGFFDFTASAQAAYGNADWANAYVEVYLFIGAIYFLCANAIAWMGGRVERRKRATVR